MLFKYEVSTKEIFFLSDHNFPSRNFPIATKIEESLFDAFILISAKNEATNKVLIDEELLELFDKNFCRCIFLKLEKQFHKFSSLFVGIFQLHDS